MAPSGAPGAAASQPATPPNPSAHDAPARDSAANQGAPANGPANTTENSLDARYQQAVAAAATAEGRKDAGAQALALTNALNLALSMPGKAGWAKAEPIVAALRDVNRGLWFNPDGDFRSTTERPAPLAKIISQLSRSTPPVRVGVGFLAKMNRLSDPNIVPGHKRLRIPKDSLNITVRRESFSLVLYLGEYAIDAFPIGIGKPESPSPVGTFEIREIQHLDQYKREATKWVRPEDGKELYYGDSEYPFGKRFMRFAEPYEHYGIHGTDRDDAIGNAISHGCIRMHNSDVDTLAGWLDSLANPKTPIRID